MNSDIQLKAVVSVAEMARMVGLSRARFYQLLTAGAFPSPVYEVASRRPIYTEELQRACLEVRRRNCGIDGKPVLFYARNRAATPIKSKKPKEPKKDVSALLAGLNSLGLTTATAAQVDAVTKDLYPGGTNGRDQGEVLRAVFLQIRRQYSGDNVGK